MSREIPMIFTSQSSRAIQEHRKWQTRRLIVQPTFEADGCSPAGLEDPPRWWDYWSLDGQRQRIKLKWAKGDRIWVKETWCMRDGARNMIEPSLVLYRADGWDISFPPWRSSRFMPRWASRLTLEIEEVRIERLNSISEEDAIAEGVTITKGHIVAAALLDECRPDLPRIAPSQQAFSELWDSLNAKRAPWDSNQWVSAITFRRVTCP